MTRKGHAVLQSSHDRALELVLENPHGQRVLDACDGDAEHALRILDELKRRDPELAEVIRLPREPILSFEDVLDRSVEEEDEVGGWPPTALASWSWLSIATFAIVGLSAWAILAGVGFGLYRLVDWLSS